MVAGSTPGRSGRGRDCVTTSSGQIVHTTFTKQYNLVPAKGRGDALGDVRADCREPGSTLASSMWEYLYLFMLMLLTNRLSTSLTGLATF